MLRSRYTTLLLVLFGLTASVLVFLEARDADRIRVRDDMKRRAETRQRLIRENLNGYIECLYNLRSAFGIDQAFPLEKFRLMARDMMARHSGFFELQWVPRVREGDRASFEQQGRQKLSPTFSVIEKGTKGTFVKATDRPEYYPIFYAEPQGRNETTLGLDLRYSEISGELKRARESGKLLVTAQLTLETSPGRAKGIIMICPVFSSVAQNLSGERDDFLGFVLGIFRVSDLLGQSWRQFSGPVTDVMVLDATANDPANRFLFYYAADGPTGSQPPPTEEQFRSGWYREIPLFMGERVWLLLHSPKSQWFEDQQSYWPYTLLFSGVTITLLFAAYLRGSLRRAELIQNEVSQRTTELRAMQAQLEEDMRRREETETLLRSSQQQLQGLMENSPNAIFVKDTDGRYVNVNRRFAELHGRTREHFSGRSDHDLFPPEIAARTRMSDARVISTAKPVELEDSFAQVDGNHTSIVHKFPLIDADGTVQGLCGIATDISERKRAEAEIRENRRQLESLLGQLPGMAFRCINDGQYTPVYVSRGALGLTGHSARDFLEKHISLQEIIHPDDRELARTAIASAVKKRRAFEVEYRLIDRSGRVKGVLERGQGVYNEEGILLFIEGLAIDITQRKDAEAEKLIVERRLLEGQKLESIGVLAGGIAHDFNNLLTGIIGNANLASLELPATSPLQQNLKQIENASQRAAELCQQMLAYAGKGRFIVQRIELGMLVENTVPLLRASISKRATLRFQLQPLLPMVMADATQMRQIVMNLVLNASEALGDRDGEIVLTTNILRPSPEFFDGAVLAPPDTSIDFIQLEVRDTGSGMSAETMAKIFDPFFTTKFAGRGLGLAAVLGIIRSHRGGLKVRSVINQGSTFTLLFPVAGPGQVETPIVRRGAVVPWKREGRALVIDDEDHVLKVTAGMLNSCGLKTDLARDGYEGLDIFRSRASQFDIVLLDMTMPRLSGEETLQLLREIIPTVRVLFMSGYNRREVVDTLAGEGKLAFIQKPFTLESLREQLQAMLAT